MANDLSTSTSSPILVGDRIYVVSEKGDLCSVDVNTGKILWRLKIGIEQRNSSPVFADGKIYVPMLDDPAEQNGGGEAGSVGAFYIVEPSDTEGKILAHVALDGRCFGTPTRLQRKSLCADDAETLCVRQKRKQRRFAAGTRAGKMANARTGHAIADHSFRSDVASRAKPDVSRPLARCKWIHRRRNQRCQKSEVGFVHSADRESSSAMNAKFDEEGELVAETNSVPSAGAFEAKRRRFERLHSRTRFALPAR